MNITTKSTNGMKCFRFFFLTLLLLDSCGKTPQPATYPGIGDTLPVFSVEMSDGSTVTSDDLSEGQSLLVFFHTGCPDCVAEMEALQPFYEKYGREVRLVLISRSEGRESIGKHWESHGYTMPYSAQQDRRIYSLFSASGIPYVVLCRGGRIIGLWNDRELFSESQFLETIRR